MKKIFIGFLLSVLCSSVFAMPCEFEYTCSSKTYEINLGICNYLNAPSLRSVKINQTLIKEASLGPAYDGTYGNQNGPLAFEVKLPPAGNEDLRVLTVEIPAKSTQGIIKEMIMEYNPGSYKTIRQEKVVCISHD